MSFDPDYDSSFNANPQQNVPRNYCRFYPKWVRNNFRSEQEGVEVGDYFDYVMIVSPGQPKSEVHRKANDNDRREFPQEWAAYKEGKEQRISGTPIEVLPGLARGVADMLKSLYIYTIEQMANLPDSALHKVGMGGNELRQKCQSYIGKNSAEVTALKARVAELEAEIAILKAKKKPGRKPKQLQEA